jgi:hypothetical protein
MTGFDQGSEDKLLIAECAVCALFSNFAAASAFPVRSLVETRGSRALLGIHSSDLFSDKLTTLV